MITSPTTGITFNIVKQPFSLLNLELRENQAVKAEASAMVYMTSNVNLKTVKSGGSLFGTIKRMFAGESFFINEFTPLGGPGRLGLAPIYTGDLIHLPLQPGERWVISGGAYIANYPTQAVDTTSRFQGLKGLFSGENVFFLEATPTQPSDLWLSAYGALQEHRLPPQAELIIDTGHLVAMESTVQYTVQRVGGWKSTFFSGEGLVLKVTGPGRVLTQTRSPQSLVDWLVKVLPFERSGG